MKACEAQTPPVYWQSDCVRGMQIALQRAWLHAFFVVAAGLPLIGCKAQVPPANWQTDCVGRMQISLPEVADIATVTPDSINMSVTAGGLPKSYFADGQAAPYSAIGYFGPVDATGRLTDREIATLRARLAEETMLIKKTMQSRKKQGEKVTFEELPTSGRDGIVWDFGSRMRGRLFIDSQYYAWGINMQPEHRPYMQKTVKSLLSGLVSRENFAIPKTSGVCMPNFFAQDDGTINRNVTITYRLRSHPDVTVIFQDASAPKVQSFQNPAKFTTKAQTNFFWTQRYQNTRSRESMSNDTINFAGQKGLETRIKLGREDGGIDYGYSAFTRGDPEATQDTPDVMLVLIRNAADAKAKGRNPISEDAFFALAKSIAASVKVRPVTK